MADEILIKNGLLVSPFFIKKADVLIADGVIYDVGERLSHRAAEVIDAHDCYVLPAFANTHTHLAMSLLRGVGEGLRLHEWLEQKIWPMEAKLTEDDVFYGALLGIAELIRGGSTVFNDMYLSNVMDAIGRATQRARINAVLSIGLWNGLENGLDITRDFVERWKEDRFVKPAVACHAPYTCDEELIKRSKRLAQQFNLLYHIHVSETLREVFGVLKEKGKRPFIYLNDLGVLDEKTVIAHAVFVSKQEILLAGKYGVVISHNPTSNLKLAGGGISPVLEFMEAGAQVTLGTDGQASNNGLNMIEAMKLAALLQKHYYWDATVPQPKDVFKMATYNGWKALGFNAGGLKQGEQAEVVVVRRVPNLYPSHDHYANVVYSMNAANVLHVISKGQFVLRDGNIVSFDEREVAQEVEESGRKLATCDRFRVA